MCDIGQCVRAGRPQHRMIGRLRMNEMAGRGKRSLIVAGNVYFCDFRKAAASRRTACAVPTLGTPRDVRLTAETLQGACRDLIAGAPALVRYAELTAEGLVSVASMIDELAFQAHIMALENRNAAAPVIGAEELQQLLLDGAAVTAGIQSCMSEANAASDLLVRRLREQAERALRLGRGVTQALDAAARNETPATP